MVERFTYGYGRAHGYHVRALGDLGQQLLSPSGVQEKLGVTSVAKHLGIVAHWRLASWWCLAAKNPSTQDVEGVLLDQSKYAAFDYDPYRTLLELIPELRLLEQCVEDAVLRIPTPDVRAPVPVEDPMYLRIAYGLFLAVADGERKQDYVSIAPRGQAASALTFFRSATSCGVDLDTLERLFPPRELLPPATKAEPTRAIAPESQSPVPPAPLLETNTGLGVDETDSEQLRAANVELMDLLAQLQVQHTLLEKRFAENITHLGHDLYDLKDAAQKLCAETRRNADEFVRGCCDSDGPPCFPVDDQAVRIESPMNQKLEGETRTTVDAWQEWRDTFRAELEGCFRRALQLSSDLECLRDTLTAMGDSITPESCNEIV